MEIAKSYCRTSSVNYFCCFEIKPDIHSDNSPIMKTVQDMGQLRGTDSIELLLDFSGKTEGLGKAIAELVSILIYICYFT